MDISISLNGFQAAERNLDQAARKIATPNAPSRGSADVLELTDYAAELIAADRAKISAKANLEVISTEMNLQHEALDLFG
jgi:hypothetical protein